MIQAANGPLDTALQLALRATVTASTTDTQTPSSAHEAGIVLRVADHFLAAASAPTSTSAAVTAAAAAAAVKDSREGSWRQQTTLLQTVRLDHLDCVVSVCFALVILPVQRCL